MRERSIQKKHSKFLRERAIAKRNEREFFSNPNNVVCDRRYDYFFNVEGLAYDELELYCLEASLESLITDYFVSSDGEWCEELYQRKLASCECDSYRDRHPKPSKVHRIAWHTFIFNSERVFKCLRCLKQELGHKTDHYNAPTPDLP